MGEKGGNKEIQDVIIKVVNDIWDEKISPNALVELNNMIRNDFILERMFFRMIPANLLGHKVIFNNLAPVSIRKGWWYNNDCFYTLGIVPIIPSVSYTYKF